MKNLLFILSAAALLLSACTHDPGVIIAGKGGSATLNVYPQHHGVASNLDSCMVYVKYNTNDAPADGVYDDSAVCVQTNSLVMCTFTGLKNGNYYFFGKGKDLSISQKVKGGEPYKITVQGPQDFDLPVSEN